MQKTRSERIPADYGIILGVCVLFVALALILDTPAQILSGYYIINVSRSVLVTDYIALGGIGAALMNSAITGFIFLFLLMRSRHKPTGVIIASLWTTIGFSLFGKNLFNVIPILIGVWLHAKARKKPFSDYFVPAMLSATIAPLVSEIAFLTDEFQLSRFLAAYAVGLFTGFIFPVAGEAAKRMHGGYCLYNSGVAGGLISIFLVGLLRSLGIEILPENIWDTHHTLLLAAFSYLLFLALLIYGLIPDGPRAALRKMKDLLNETEPEKADFLTAYGSAAYINMGAMGILSTSIMLFMGIPINGPVLGGIFTVAGFAAYGKHLKNCAPILLGSITAVILNHLESTAPSNTFAILFSTGLAPMAGKFGWRWGFIIGVLHVSLAIFIGALNGGLNLYNNGFAGGFVPMIMVPLITFFREVFFPKAELQVNSPGLNRPEELG